MHHKGDPQIQQEPEVPGLQQKQTYIQFASEKVKNNVLNDVDGETQEEREEGDFIRVMVCSLIQSLAYVRVCHVHVLGLGSCFLIMPHYWQTASDLYPKRVSIHEAGE